MSATDPFEEFRQGARSYRRATGDWPGYAIVDPQHFVVYAWFFHAIRDVFGLGDAEVAIHGVPIFASRYAAPRVVMFFAGPPPRQHEGDRTT